MAAVELAAAQADAAQDAQQAEAAKRDAAAMRQLADGLTSQLAEAQDAVKVCTEQNAQVFLMCRVLHNTN